MSTAGIDRPLSFAQERLWFLTGVYPRAAVYVVRRAYRLVGALDVAALQRSVDEIARRHSALRTTFPTVDGRPVQAVAPRLSLPLRSFDLSRHPENRHSAQLARLAREQVSEPFDLAEGPLQRLHLVRLGSEEHVLLLAVHHIVFDGWSLAILLRELAALYEAFSNDQASPLPMPAGSYLDFARWQRQRLQGDRLRRELSHWRERMEGAPPGLELPSDHRRPARPTFRGGVRTLCLSSDLSAAVEKSGRRLGATLFMTLLAAFKAVLARHTLASDVTVGSSVAGRTRTEHEALIGLFANVLVLRSRWTGDPSFAELLKNVRGTCLDAFGHQELPFEALVEELNPTRELSRNPLFQVMFSLHSEADPPRRMAEVAIQPLELARDTARFDLTLDVFRTRDGLTCQLEYSADLFEAATGERLLRHFERTLEQIASDPRQRLSELPSPDAAERLELTVARNPPAESPTEPPALSRFERWAERSPEAPALVCGADTLSYDELNRRANRLAHLLSDKGVGPEVRVGVLLDRSPDMVVAVLAVLKAGGAYVPLDPSHPAERLADQLTDCKARVLIGDAGGALQEPPPGVVRVDPRRQGAEIRSKSDRNPLPAGGADSLAYVIYTSGSTGQPKGVMVTRRCLDGFCSALDRYLGGESEDVWLAVTPLSFDISVMELFWTLTRGSRVVVHPGVRDGWEPAHRRRAPGRVELSLFFFASPEPRDAEADRYRLLLESARLADGRRFLAVWTPERHFHSFGGIFPNPAVTGAALAEATRRLRIRAGSVVLPLHDPIRVAEEWSVVDNLSGGRVDISLASGWHPNDFVFAPDSYENRKEILVSGIDRLRRLWRGESVSVTGEDGEERSVHTFPRPIQRDLPLWMTTAGNPESFRLAGEQGCNVLTHLLGQDLAALAEKIEIYRGARRRGGLDGEGHVTLMLHTFVASDSREARRLARNPLRRYLESSFDLLGLATYQRPDLDVGGLTRDERAALIEGAVDRHIEVSGLIGSPAHCEAMLEGVRAIGIDEVACLIDFGLDFETVMAGVEELAGIGDRLAAAAEPAAREPALGELIEGHGVTHLQCTPSLLAMIEAENGSLAPLAGLRALFVGGEVFPAALAARARGETAARVHNLYGPTEATIWSTVQELESVETTVPIGRPLANTRIYLLDRQLRPVPDGIPGEICIGGAGVARGYFDRPALTAERFLPDPFDQGVGARLYRTGDLARYRSNGELEFLERIDDQVKIAGHRIEPGEIEAALNRHPSVRESAVVSRPGREGLVAWIVPAVSAPGRTTWETEGPAEPPPAGGDGRGVYRLPDGLRILCGSRQQAWAGYRELIRDEIYFRHEIDVEEGDCVFDVGANIGLFSLSVRRRCPSATIYAFEPVPPTFEMLRTNLESHGVRARCFPYGLADRSAELELTHYPMMAGLSGLELDGHRHRDLAKAMLLAQLDGREAEAAGIDDELDRLLEERYRSETHVSRVLPLSEIVSQQGIDRIDLLKIDVEGAEHLVLRGIRDRDWRKIGQLAIEIHSAELLALIRGEVEGRGFETHSEERVLDAGGNGRQAESIYHLYARNPSLASGRRRARPGGVTKEHGLSADALRAHLRRRLPEPMIPTEFRTIDRLPLTSNGKLDRKRLRRTSGSRLRMGSTFEAPGNRLEEGIAEVWRQVLSGHRIGVTDSFFDLGGNSLLLVQVMVRLRASLGRHISIADLFEFPTIRSLARHLAADEPANGAALAGRRRGELRKRFDGSSAARGRG